MTVFGFQQWRSRSAGSGEWKEEDFFHSDKLDEIYSIPEGDDKDSLSDKCLKHVDLLCSDLCTFLFGDKGDYYGCRRQWTLRGNVKYS